MEERKKTFWERAVAVFLVFVGVLNLVLLTMLFAVMFDERVEYWAKEVLGVGRRRDVITFIGWGVTGILAFLGVIEINRRADAQVVNNSMEKVKKLWQRAAVYLLAFVGAVGVVSFILLFAVIFNERVESLVEEFFGVMNKQDIIEFISLSIAGILIFFGASGAIRWKVAKIKNSTMNKKKTIWREVKARRRRVRVFWRKMKVVWKKRVVPVFLFIVGAVGVVMFVLLFVVMFNERVDFLARGILDVVKKQEVIEFISLSIAGILTFFGAIAVNKRADAQVGIAKSQLRTVKTQVENNKLIEKGHVQERFKAAVKHLGNEREIVRIASFYEFSHLASDNDELRRNIFDILCAHLRCETPNKKIFQKIEFVDEKEIPQVKPTEEIQSLLDVLFRPEGNQGELIFVGLPSNLRGISLVRANLREANLQNADLQSADLRGTELHEADLQEAQLIGAKLQEANFYKANLRGARLLFATLMKADLFGADLRGADLRGTNLREVKNLDKAKLNGVDVRGAQPPEGFDWPEGVNRD